MPEKIFDLISEETRKAFDIDKDHLKKVTVEDINNMALALRERAMQRGRRAGETCCCCQTCCCCAAAVVD